MSARPRELPIRLVDGPGSAKQHDHADHTFESGGRTAVPAPPKAFVFVNGEPINEQAIGQEMQHHPSIRPEESRRAAAEALVVRRLLQLEAARCAIDGQAIAEPGENAEEAATRVLLEPVFDQVQQPTEAACRHYYEQNQQQFRHPDHLRLRHVLYAAAPDDVEDRLAKRDAAERAIAELKQHPERFAEYAMRFSACPSKDQGGDLGWIQRGQTTPEFERQVFRLKPGLAGLPVESRYGHHVVCIDSVKKGDPLDFDQVASDIALRLDLAQRQSAMKQYVEDLMARYPVEGLDAAL